MKQPQNDFEALSATIPGVDFSDRSATALVVVDVQHSDATEGRGWVKACEAVDPGSMRYYLDRLEQTTIPAIRRLLKAFRDSGRPVIHLCTGSLYQDMRDCPARFRDWTRELEIAGGVKDMWWVGNPDFAFLEEVAPLAQETIIRKTTQGAFNGSEIDTTLQRMGIKNLVFSGVVTSCCVETTARDAADRGYGCVLVSDACADCDEAMHDAAMLNFGLYFGKVVDTAEELLVPLTIEGRNAR
ncbi:cysteine hydrolase family protein [Pseudomonas sp. RT4P38]